MKRVILVGMLLFFFAGWGVTAKNLTEKPAQYRQLISEAERYESEKIYVRAIESYKQALELKPESVDLKTRIATDYLALGDEASFINHCNAINTQHKYPLSVVTLLSDYYMETHREDKAIRVLQEGMKRHKNQAELQERYEKVRFTYKDLYINYDEIFLLRNDSAVVMDNGLYGLVNKNGRTIMKCQNDWVGALSGDRSVIPVCRDGEFYFANSSGYRIEVPQDGQHIEELGVLCNGAAPAKSNGKYGYVNGRFEELCPFLWDGATVIQNGFGAVCQGGKWGLIDDSFVMKTDYIYDDVKVDDYGYCSISDRAFVKTSEGYWMVDEKGNRVGEQTFEDAVPFMTDQATAVKMNGAWGFVKTDGTLLIEPQYEGAGAFSGGLAPVQTLSGWGYINLDNQMVIPDEYTQARSFYKGLAPVKRGNIWTIIELNVKE